MPTDTGKVAKTSASSTDQVAPATKVATTKAGRAIGRKASMRIHKGIVKKPVRKAGIARKAHKVVQDRFVRRSARQDFNLSLQTFSKMTGIPEPLLATWESSDRYDFTGRKLDRLDRTVRILDRMAKVVKRSYIPTWVEKPNDACKELGCVRPLDLFESGAYAALETMVYYLESGAPG